MYINNNKTWDFLVILPMTILLVAQPQELKKCTGGNSFSPTSYRQRECLWPKQLRVAYGSSSYNQDLPKKDNFFKKNLVNLKIQRTGTPLSIKIKLSINWGGEINKWWYIHTVEYWHTAAEINQTQETYILCDSIYTAFLKGQNFRARKQIDGC